MSIQDLKLTYNPSLEGLVPEDGYWLTIEQIKEDEKATVEFVAETIDALFDISFCVEEEGEEPIENPPVDTSEFDTMEEVLNKIGEKTTVDMSACEMLRMGTYQARLKIVRSHPEEPYTLRLSVGTILETKIIEEAVSVNINVLEVSSVRLPYPTTGNLRCSWIGSVIGKNGNITFPTIQVLGNTLFWNESVTGVIRAEFNTIYDLVDVEIPGVPNYEGADLGTPQDSEALVFYHYLTYRAGIIPPEYDEDLLEEVCGYSSGTGIDEDDDEPLPEPPPPPEPVYGCIDYYPLAPHGSPVTEPWFYEQTCCVPGSFDGCRVRTSRREGGKGLSEAKIAEMIAEWPGPIEFIGLGPITPEGCGTRYEETKVNHRNCCDEVEPMAWDSETSAEVVAPGSRVLVGVIGGAPPYHWSVRGNGFSLDGYNMRDGVTDTPYTWIYAADFACGFAPIEVSDGCSVVTDGVRCTQGRWVETIYPVSLGVAGYNSGFSPGYDTVCYEGISGRYKTWFVYSPKIFSYPNWTQQAVIDLACSEPPMAYYSDNPYVLPPAGYIACGTESGMYYNQHTGPDFGTSLSTLRPGAGVPIAGYLDGAKSWEWVC